MSHAHNGFKAIRNVSPAQRDELQEMDSPLLGAECGINDSTTCDSSTNTNRLREYTTASLHPSDKYILDRGTGEIVPGNYTCLVSPNPTLLGTQQSSSATQQLVLPTKLDILNGSAVMITVDATSPVTVWCEMFQYIRPDSSLLWYHNHSEGPLPAGPKYDVRYVDGTRQTRLGSAATRISVLTISNFTFSDLGNYSCRVGDEYALTSLQLIAAAGQVSGNSKPSFRVIKGAFEQRNMEPAAIAASSRLDSLPALVIILLVLCCM
ncbi:hypothetical protein EMCRGX_G020435 [Ephydatia muelleri]